MTAGKNGATFGELLLQGAREAAAHASGDDAMIRKATVTRPVTARHVRLRRPNKPSPARIREIRAALNVSQSVFSDLLSVSASTVRAWEQGQRSPDGPSLRLLEIAEHDPAALLDVATRAQTQSTRRTTASARKVSSTMAQKSGKRSR